MTSIGTSILLISLSLFLNLSTSTSLNIYLGNGCFWGRQHDIITEVEQHLWQRPTSALSTIGGYAGGHSSYSCYYNSKNTSIYSDNGDAEVIQIYLDSTSPSFDSQLFQLFSHYFTSFIPLDDKNKTFGREDIYDWGNGYRALIGFPGGIKNETIMSQIKKANLHSMTLLQGSGSDSDTFGKNQVYIMDSSNFPFKQAELCLQFHNNQTGTYPESYHDIKNSFMTDGKIKKTMCPKNYVC